MKADTPKTYRLVEMRGENFKKLKAFSVKIDGTIFKVAGRNEQGKSSLLDAVAADGRREGESPGRPASAEFRGTARIHPDARTSGGV